MKKVGFFAPLALLLAAAALPMAAYAAAAPSEDASSVIEEIDVSEYEQSFDLGAVTADDGSTRNRVAYVGHQDITGADGETVTLGFASYENQPTDFAAASGDCAGGNHPGKVYDGRADLARTHQQAAFHPCPCMDVCRRDWHCTSCGTDGTDTVVWTVFCPDATL